MPLDKQLASQLQQTILVASSTAINNYGERTYSTGVSHKGRVRGKTEMVRNYAGLEVVSQVQVIFSSTVTVGLRSRIYLPDETSSGNEGWQPYAVATRVDENGNDVFIKVWLGEIGGEK